MEEWTPHPGPQTEILRRKEFELLYGGARGGGKSEAGLAWLSEPEYFYHPEYRCLILRKNAEDLADWLLRARRFWAGDVSIIGKPPVLRFPGGGVGTVGHLKDDSAYEKYQGHEYHKILFEELTQIPKETQYLMVATSCRTTGKLKGELPPQILATTNPGGPGHVWVKNRWVVHPWGRPYTDPQTKKTRIFIPSRAVDNPSLDEDYWGFLKGLPETIRKAWLDGSWDIYEGQAFPELSRETHGFNHELPEHWPLYISADWGYSAPYSVQFWRLDGDGCGWMEKELYGWSGKANKGTGETVDQVAENIRTVLKTNYPEIKPSAVFLGPDWFNNASGRAPVDALTKAEIYPCIEVKTGSGYRNKVFWEFQRRIKGRGIKVHLTNCHHWWRTVPELIIDTDKLDQGKEDIDTKQEDHGYDATGFFILSRAWAGNPATQVIKKEKLRNVYEDWFTEEESAKPMYGVL